MSEQKQCCAPLNNSKRCTKNIIDNSSIHCEDHYRKGIKLYKVYKILCNLSKILDVKKVDTFTSTLDKIKYLNKCYNAYFKAYEGRMEHRIYGLVPECYNYGHDLQFEILMDNINYCESQLETLYKKYFKETSGILKDKINIGEELTDSKESLEVQEVIEKVKDFKKKRANDKRKEDTAIKKYIKENKKIISKKLIIIDQVISKIKSLMIVNPEYEYYQIISLYGAIIIMVQVIESLFKNNKDTTLIKPFYLSNPSLKKYTQLRDYLSFETNESLVYVLDNLENSYALFNNFFVTAESFWTSKGINPLNIINVVIWNPQKEKFLMAYIDKSFFNTLVDMKDFSQIETCLNVKPTKIVKSLSIY